MEQWWLFFCSFYWPPCKHFLKWIFHFPYSTPPIKSKPQFRFGKIFHSCIQQNTKRVEVNVAIYKKRQALVEDPFGTIKRQWGFDHIMTKKGIASASADFGLIALAYNLKRLIKLGWIPNDRLKHLINTIKLFLEQLIKRTENLILAEILLFREIRIHDMLHLKLCIFNEI